MFAGKTTELLRRLRAESASAIAVFKHNKDRRYSLANIATHDGDAAPAMCVAKAHDILEHVGQATEVVAIDEGHFYDSELPNVCKQLAERGKRVIVTTLDADMWGLPFATIERLKQLAGEVCLKTAVCAVCGRPATHTHRLTPIRQRNLVGGGGDFEPRCRTCWSPPPEEHIDSADMP